MSGRGSRLCYSAAMPPVVSLVTPDIAYAESMVAGLREFRAEGLPWYATVDPDVVAADFPAFVRAQLAKATHPQPGMVPKTELWGVLDGVYVGRVGIHHTLTDGLRVFGGHIGYDTRPSFRGRGVATAMLRCALPVARALGLSRVLITCDDTNVASIRVIERNGGALEATRSLDPARPLKRYYWIALDG